MTRSQLSALFTICLLQTSGCSKKVATTVLPPPPPAAQGPATAQPSPAILAFQAEPASIERGQSAVLHWRVEHAETVRLLPDGARVNAEGTLAVAPDEAKEYKLVAESGGGQVTAVARVNVTPPASAEEVAVQQITKLKSELRDVYFDYDRAILRDDARQALIENANVLLRELSDRSQLIIQVEGHCDERGSAEYNFAMGDQRAMAAVEFLVGAGVPANRLMRISYGSERPVCTEATEDCWQRNRRVHLEPVAKTVMSSRQ